MKLLITGGAGFIGSNFIRYMLNEHKDYKIINLDKLTYAGNLDNLKDVEKNPNYKFVKGDICDGKVISNTIKDCDVIINFAAETHVDRSILGPESFIRTDVLGTHTLLEAARKQNIRLLQISTDEVYGSIENGSFTEHSPIKPNSPYSASKAAADLLCISYFTTYSTDVVITRSSNNFGPYQYPEKLIPLFITNLLEGKKVPLYGDGLNVRDWLYVLDNCSAIDLALHKGKSGEIYNISSNSEKTNLEITNIIISKLKKSKDFIQFVKDRPGHDRRYSLNSAKIRTLGWKPGYKFEEAMEKTIDWYKKNECWWKKIKSGEYLDYYRKQYSGFK